MTKIARFPAIVRVCTQACVVAIAGFAVPAFAVPDPPNADMPCQINLVGLRGEVGQGG